GGNGMAGYGGLASHEQPDPPEARFHTANGGGVYCDDRSAVTFINSVIRDNTSAGSISGQGGVGYWGWQRQPRKNYIVPSYGAGVYCDDDSGVTFTGCTIQGNRTTHEVGAPNDPNDPNGPIQYVTGTYTGLGGGICFWSAGTSTLVDCNVLDNFATVGGGIYALESDVHITDSNFYSNSSFAGAGLLVEESEATISGSLFRANTAASDVNEAQEVVDIQFGTGGGLYIKATYAEISDCVITENFGALSGGGICFDGDFPSIYSALLKNCLITNNIAGREGGGITIVWFAAPNISNCTIADNIVTQIPSYGGGLYTSFGSDTTIIDSIIWGNKGTYGSQISIEDDPAYPLASTIAITHSVVDNRSVKAAMPIDPNALPVIRPGFDSYSLAANDDLYTDLVDIGFTIDYYGTIVSNLYVNNNGNVTFDAPLGTFTPFGLTGEIGTSIIAPFFADVDTQGEGSELVTYGTGMVDGHVAFGVNWLDVGYFFARMDKLNTFQLILIDRSDRAPGDFDIEFNYEKIEWETGEASFGVDGLGGLSAVAGFSNGTGDPGTFHELEGSGVNGAFLDSSGTGLIYRSRNSSVPGRLIFAVESGVLNISAGVPIYVDDGCILAGWEADEPNCPWQLGTENICDDPCFVVDYYLSHVEAGQDTNSPAIDIGSAPANDPNISLHEYTTRTDGANDMGIVDIGYHHREGAPEYELTVTVVDENGDPVDPNLARGYVDPNSGWYYKGKELTLRAVPDPNYYVRGWYDENGTVVSIDRTLEVVMDSNQTFAIEFKPMRVVEVSGGGDALLQAVNNAENGDVLIVTEGTYDGEIDLQGKEIKLFSFNHNDPNVVPWTIIDCQGTGRGFIFDSGEDANTSISGFRIINGNAAAGQGGGAIFIGAGASPTIANMIISDCTATDVMGGAIYIGHEASPRLLNVTINNCNAYSSDGGAIYAGFNSSPEFIGCTITNCTVTRGSGGAVYCGMSSSTVFTDCTFADNYAISEAGIPGPNAITTYSGGDGGAIRCAVDCDVQLTNCTFTGNIADFLGGGIGCNVDNTITVIDCEFEDNLAQYGGAVYLDYNCVGTITGTTLVSNEADEDGGALYFTDSDIRVTDSNLSYNSAIRGGGLYSRYSPTAEIINCTIKYNKAQTIGPNDPNMLSGGRGGGIFAFAGPGLIADCEIGKNNAKISGGGLYLSSDFDLQATVRTDLRNCLISNNTAGRDGGGVSCNWWIDATISNCTIADNVVTGMPAYGGGLYCSYESDVEVINSIIWGNRGSDGAQIAVAGDDESIPLPSRLNITYSAIGPPYDPNEAFDLDLIDPCDSGQGAGGSVLVDGQTIYHQFDAGEE
ncbi:MAG: right-handed parallel beta-helix repeat-containing protein, partial [Planctomycetota bacterium]